MRVLDHAAVHAEYEQLGQVVGERQQTFGYNEPVAHEYHVERRQTEVERAEHELQQYDVPVTLVQLVFEVNQPVVKHHAALHVIQELLFGGLVGGLIVLDDLDRVFDVGGQYLELGYHLADEERKRTHDAGYDELYGHDDQKLYHKRNRIHPDLQNV